jgi:hypothetical protein
MNRVMNNAFVINQRSVFRFLKLLSTNFVIFLFVVSRNVWIQSSANFVAI